jgi:hypothetical protein
VGVRGDLGDLEALRYYVLVGYHYLEFISCQFIFFSESLGNGRSDIGSTEGGGGTNRFR